MAPYLTAGRFRTGFWRPEMRDVRDGCCRYWRIRSVSAPGSRVRSGRCAGSSPLLPAQTGSGKVTIVREARYDVCQCRCGTMFPKKLAILILSGDTNARKRLRPHFYTSMTCWRSRHDKSLISFT